MALWIVASLALLIAAGTLFYARGLAQKLAHVTEMYWQLKFDHGELKAKLDPSVPATPAPQQTFVPLSSMKRP
jgi:predicted NAD/FAD-dependent oxidoreductase